MGHPGDSSQGNQGNPGNRETGKPGNRETGKPGKCPSVQNFLKASANPRAAKVIQVEYLSEIRHNHG